MKAACAQEGAYPFGAPPLASRPDDRFDSAPGMGQTVGRYFDAVPFALCILDRARHVLFVNEQMAQIAGHRVVDLDGYCVTALLPELRPILEKRYRLAGSRQPLPDLRISWRGREYMLTFNATYDRGGELAEMMIGAIDITREARIEQGLRRSRRRLLASLRTDHLTGLLNRRGLETAVRRGLRCGARERRPVGLLVADIDCFKAYNDRFGHVTGDTCLMAVAQIIGRHGARAGGAVGRYGGEEFVVLLPDADGDAAVEFAESCRAAIEALAIAHPDSPVGRVTISIGVTVASGEGGGKIDSSVVSHCIGTADSALYRAKEQGRNAVRFQALP
ncbi:sensor domain-containing diguanylate cyclase [Novosphingobium sp. PhB165]|uniref:GGDEF domain-containing protein n=1 Tax=Novosphingobium sp. PhB165 TaxID=2485105 RepID=UPI0014055BAF|nr:sensor domain-containing diguanylate cyclase [Novosphingobium sp. PhB165]